jgi:hypothetical protein
MFYIEGQEILFRAKIFSYEEDFGENFPETFEYHLKN